MPSSRIPRNVEEVIALRDAERALDADVSTSRGSSKPSKRGGNSRSREQQSTRREYYSARSTRSRTSGACCLWCRNLLILICALLFSFTALLIFDEYYRIELCHTVTPKSDARVCHLLAVKNTTLSTLEMLQRVSEPYLANATAWSAETMSSAWSSVQDRLTNGDGQ